MGIETQGHGRIHMPRSQESRNNVDTSAAVQASNDDRPTRGHGAIHSVQPSQAPHSQCVFGSLKGPTLASIAVIEKNSPPEGVTGSKGRGGGMVAWPEGDRSPDISTIQDKKGDRSWYDF